MDIRITLNNKDMVVPSGTTVNGLLEMAGYSSRVAVWINGRQLLSAEYPSRVIEEGDAVKILRLAAGG
ncbi:MAG: sulfur carrier protein ThiS [Anaerovoracaceae bacterium]|jgi:thiamine biosynthesis protein ThiS